jgi:hypothetical protein
MIVPLKKINNNKKMQKFPDNFNLKCTNESLNNNETETIKIMRTLVYDTAQIYSEQKYEYFFINFSGYTTLAIKIILKELLERFPNAIGYNDKVFIGLPKNTVQYLKNNAPGIKNFLTIKIIKNLDEIDSDKKYFVVALTENFKEQMEKYFFPGR